jgi:DNA-binding MarR family transcriptional regulator
MKVPNDVAGKTPGARRSPEQKASQAHRGAGRAIARLARHVERELATVDLSLPQYRILGLLAEGSSASSSLADRLTVSPPSVTSVVDGLVARGLVLRIPDLGDRRRLNLELTRVGRELLVDADASVESRLFEIAAHFDHIDPDGAVACLESWHASLDRYRDARRKAKGQPSGR